MAFVRYGIPLAMTIAGIVALTRGGSGGGLGVVLIGSALIVLMLNVLFRMSLVSNRERDDEERARDQFTASGRWPDEES